MAYNSSSILPCVEEVFRLTPKLRAESTGSKYVMISHSIYDLKLQVEQQSQGLLLESGTDEQEVAGVSGGGGE